jgi:U1 small nuclear ribonucleoprotein
MHSLFSLGSFTRKIPPSDLGFVCKPELPPHINILFRARPPLRFLNFPHKGIHRHYTGVFDCDNNNMNIFDKFEKETPKKENKLPKHVIKIIDIIKNMEIEKEKNKSRIKNWNPKLNSKATGNPYKTLFVYRLPKNVDENLLKYEFEEFGTIKDVKIIKNRKGENKGYAFIEFERTKDFREALERGNKKKINGRHVNVEAERGRTDNKFKPMRFWGENGKGRELPYWLQEQIKQVEKNYPDIVKKAIDEEKNKIIIKEKKDELEIGEIEDDNYLKKKRIRNKSRSKSSQKSNSKDSYRSHKKKWNYDNKNFYEDDKKKKKVKEESEEGEID